ncbi:MAG TPA: TldD/PmbA family protein [Candidatus Acidoferrales bacterium]|nr:TldD/PmbA family protein [Candidatus Acidoferrales bacterium]
MLTKEQFQKLAEKAISFTQFPECAVSLSSTESAFIRFALNGVTTSGFVVNQSLGISVTKDKKSGSTSVDDFEDKSIREAVQRAEQIALLSPANPEDVPPIGPQKYPAIENFVDTTARARNPVMAPHAQAVIEAAKSRGLVAAGYFERSAGHFATANKAGNFGFGRYTDAYLSSTVRNAAGTSSGWAAQPAVRIEDISGEAIGRTAAEKCLKWKDPVKLDPGKYTVVLEPTAVGDLIPLMAFSMQARAAEEGRSFLSRKGGGTQLGEKLFPDFITLRSDPFHKLYPALPWGNGGLPNAPTAWIENGVVKNLFYDRYWALKTGKEPTPFPNNLILDGGTKSLDDLIASVDRGLLVTRFWYIRPVNPQTVQLTGLTRDGLFLIEGGKVARPVVNFRFNESPVRLLQNTIAMGKPVRTRGGESGMIAPPLVVKDFPFTSISDAV